MAVLCGVVGSLSAFYHDRLDINDPEHRRISAFRLIAKMPTIAALGVQLLDRPAVHLSAQRPGLCGEFPAHVSCRAGGAVSLEPGARARDGPDLHPARRSRAERLYQHGAPCRIDRRQPVRLHRGRIASLWGPAHGGANEAVLKMLERNRDIENIPRLHREGEGQEQPVRLMGFGHRVYKNYDPRAR